MADNETQESFAEFKDSFSYGSRSDLNFKFLKGLSPEDAAQFFQDLLREVGELVDGGPKDRLIDFVYRSQVKGYAGAGRYVYEEAPFTRLKQPLAETRLALMSSSGHFVAGDDPNPLGVEAMTQAEAEARINEFVREEPQLSAIPMETPLENLQVRHGGYDVRGAQKDANVNFPIDRMRELRDEGVLPKLHPAAFSFVGACSQMRLQKETASRWAEYFHECRIDALLLVPV
jgi:hypothetical protein